MRMVLLTVASLGLLLGACESPSPSDGGPLVDGALVDGGGELDAGPLVDSGVDGGPAPPEPCEEGAERFVDAGPYSIDCILDLGGQSVELPADIELRDGGGYITNGTLVFDGGTIAGPLLTLSLLFEGTGQLDSNVFGFIPDRWEMAQGTVTQEQAETNRENLNVAMERVQGLGADTFQVGAFDAFFHVGWRRGNRAEQDARAIRMRSNFHFEMSDDTYLRVFPNDDPAYSLISFYDTDHATLSGGNLVGDRFEHTYDQSEDVLVPSHEFGFLMYVVGSHDALIDNVRGSQPTGDVLVVHSLTIRRPDGTLGEGNRTTERLLVRGGVFSEARRNNISIVDADGVVIDGVTVRDAGHGERVVDGEGNTVWSDAGIAPRYGMDIEALRYVDEETGELNEINRIRDVTVRNSTFENNLAGDIDVYTVQGVLIEQNHFDKWVGNFASSDVVVQDNDFVSRDPEITFAIKVSYFIRDGESLGLVHDWTIRGNRISNYRVGISVGADRITVEDNTITDCGTGIQMTNLDNSVIRRNVIRSTRPGSFGHSPFVGTRISNTTVSEEQVTVTNRPLNLRRTNADSEATDIELTFEDCEFVTNSRDPFRPTVSDSRNILIRGCRSTYEVEVVGGQNIQLENNTLLP